MISKNIPIGEVLKEYGYINEEQLSQALSYQKENRGKRLGGILIELGFITEKQMLTALAQRLNLRQIELQAVSVDVQAVEKIPEQLAKKYGILALEQTEHGLMVALNDPLNFYGIEDVRQTVGQELEILLCEKAPLEKALHFYYSEVAARDAAKRANVSQENEVEEIELEEGDGDTPIINLLNMLVQRAYTTTASDIHIEPFEDKTIVRMRIDGVIVDYVTLQKGLHASLIARIKILSNLDIAERRVPQDGHFRTRVGEEMVNIRVSVIPTVFGEKAVLRLLAGNAVIENVGSYGMIPEDYEKFRKILKSPNGIIYITGPTGSGKSTTLYMILEEMSRKQINVSTIEDPVEKNIPRINQMQTNQMAGLTFDVGLRALLRQDPDVIMVGETRDAETAAISIRAAITGHLVLSTLHTNNAAASIVRLVDMGMEPYMIASSLVGVVAQRLMRRVCPECSVLEAPSPEERLFLGDRAPSLVRRAKGCARCNHTGYRGRVAVHEIICVDGEIRKMISGSASVEEIAAYAEKEQGMKPLAARGLELVEKGETTVDELVKIAYYS